MRLVTFSCSITVASERASARVLYLSLSLVTESQVKTQSDQDVSLRRDTTRACPPLARPARARASGWLGIVEETDARGLLLLPLFGVCIARDMLLRLVASAFFLRAVTTTNDAVVALKRREHAVSIPKTATSLCSRSGGGFIYSGSFLVTRLHPR